MQFSLLQPLRSVPLAFIDVETTGASCQWGDRVTEVGVVRYENGRKITEYQQLIDPCRHIGAGIVALTGITPAMVAGQPKFTDQIPQLMELLRGAAVLGHNVRFDLSFLTGECRRCGKELAAELGDVPVLDTVRIARKRFGRGGNGLQNLSRRLGIEPVTAHRALADAQTTALVFEKLLEPLGGWDMTLLDAIMHQGGPMRLAPDSERASERESVLPFELEEAIEQQTTVIMEYLDARSQRTQRTIRPLEIRRLRGELTLIAHCELRQDRRNFKVDRIVKLTRCADRAGDGSTALTAGGPALPAASADVEQETSLEDSVQPQPSMRVLPLQQD